MTSNSPISAVTTDTTSHPSGYAMGFTDGERKRLMQQGAVLREPTAALFRAAGIGPGMHALDIGSGAGDVAMLAADLVGPTGSVMGLDRDPDSIARATQRVADAGYKNIQFQKCEFHEFAGTRPLDALVGRFILMYLPDPAATLRTLAANLRSGAAIAFFEPDFTCNGVSVPEVPLFRKCGEWMVGAMRACGVRVDMGMHLYHTYRAAGFIKAGCMASHLSGCGFQPGLGKYFSETIRSLLPKIEQHNIASRDEVDIETLTERLEEAARIADPQWVGMRYVGGWASKP
jgi:ubiquinone/menaquinone biosynthesis C-methylase UbiE